MGLTTIQDFVVDTLIEKQSITKEKLSNAKAKQRVWNLINKHRIRLEFKSKGH